MPKPKRYTVSDGKLVLTLEVAEEGGYIVTSPLNPEVLTQAETIEEAFENARDVISLFNEERASAKKAKPPAIPRVGTVAGARKSIFSKGQPTATKPLATKKPRGANQPHTV